MMRASGRIAAIGLLLFAPGGFAGSGASGGSYPDLRDFPPKPAISAAEEREHLLEQLVNDRTQGQALAAGAMPGRSGP
jgi:hypothetical protein